MKPEGWGPWNVRAVNALVHLPSGLELRIGIRTPDGKEHWELRWKQVARLGPYSQVELPDGRSFRAGNIRLRVDEALFDVRLGDLLGDGIVVAYPANDVAERCDLLVVLQMWKPLSGSMTSKPKEATFTSFPGKRFTDVGVGRAFNATIKLFASKTLRLKLGDRPCGMPFKGKTVATVRLKGIPSGIPALGQIPNDGPPYRDLTPEQRNALKAHPFETAFMPPSLELDEALWRGVAWNTIYHPRLKRLMTPVSRDWCVDDNNFGDYVLFPWDTFFCSVLASRRDKDLAYANVRAVLAEMTDRGMLPNVNGGAGQTLDRSQPPVGAYCVWKLHEKFNDLDFLAEVYPPLKRWHAFWMKYRDGNGDGLLEWGSDPIPAPVDWWKPHTQQAAKWESGLDNSPMYEDIPFNEAANTLELADIGLSCLYAADAEALAKMADALGLADEAQGFREEFAQVSQRINNLLWDEEHGIYCNGHWDGRLSERWSPTSFYALYAGVATPERAERCVKEHLMNPDEFWGQWVIPSISRKDPNFPVQKYWQGRVWPPMNFLCYEGLRRYGFHAEADELAAKSEALFLKEWREEGHIHENYNAITADGDDVNPDDPEGSSDPIYTWGGLLAYIALDARERKQPSESIHR